MKGRVGNQARALAADALHQVLDNGVFRVLAVLCALPVLFTFVLGFREEGVVLLFGLRTWSYADLMGLFGQKILPPDVRGLAIEVVLQIVLQFLAGSLGMLVALSATSFFVPRLLERGAAELYFHKPVSRGVLLLSRYLAGLLFVALVSFLLVAGMYLGLLLVSGHHDAGILLAALTLTYSFAPIYAFTLLCGVVTRSTMASLLLSSFFFLFNGCIHKSWIQWQQASQGPSMRVVLEQGGAGEEQEDEGAGPSEALSSDEPGTVGNLLRALDVVHLILPKTTDADYLARKLRAALDAPLFRDESYVTLARLPQGLELLDPATLAAEPLAARLGEALLLAGEGEARHSLWRRPAERSETRIGERVRERIETASQAAKSLAKELEERAGVADLELERKSVRLSESRGALSVWRVTWREAGLGTRTAHAFKGLSDDTVYTLLVDLPGEPTGDELERERGRLAQNLYLDQEAANDWYLDQLAFDAPLRFNILFSLGSTLAFAAGLLALGRWRLARLEL